MKRSFLVTLVVLSSVGVAIAVAQPAADPAAPTVDPTAPSPTPTAEPAPTPERSAEEVSRRSQVYSKVGEVEITVGDIEDAINNQQPFLRNRFSEPARLAEHAERMVRFELLAREAARREFGDNAAVVRSGKQNAVQHLIRTEFDQRVTPESITDEEIRAHYDAHIAEFRRPEMVRASHILVNDEALARDLIQQANGADVRAFRALARRHSVDSSSKLRGGDLRYFTNEGRPPGGREDPVDGAIVAAAFALEEVGDVAAEPVPVGEAFSVVKLTGRRATEERSYENAEQGIRLRLWREKRQSSIDEFVQNLRREIAPEIHPERMRAIRLPPVDPAQGFQDAHGRARPTAEGATAMEAPNMEAAPSAME